MALHAARLQDERDIKTCCITAHLGMMMSKAQTTYRMGDTRWRHICVLVYVAVSFLERGIRVDAACVVVLGRELV